MLVALLASAVDAILGALAGRLTEAVLGQLERDPSRRALEVALGNAIERFSTVDGNFAISAPLFDEHGLLTTPEVKAELAKVLDPRDDPDPVKFARAWAAALGGESHGDALVRAADELLGYFRDELHRTEAFRGVLAVKSLEEIREGVDRIAEHSGDIDRRLQQILDVLSGLIDLLEAGYTGLPSAPAKVRNWMRDSTGFIEEWTRGFVGRRFVVDEIDAFLREAPRGFFFIVALPGIGKTAFASQFIKTRHVVHHFNRGTSTSAFLGNVCAQLIGTYGLPYTDLQQGATADGHFLSELLSEVARNRGRDEKVVIVVDALDEVQPCRPFAGANPLSLPDWVPAGVYFVITSKPLGPPSSDAAGGASHPCPVDVRVSVEQSALAIRPDGPENLADIRVFLTEQSADAPIAAYCARHGLDREDFVERLCEKSEGNFMYLHHVLLGVRDGRLEDQSLDELPQGLIQYYTSLFDRIRGDSAESWFEYKERVLVALNVFPEPATVAELAELSGVRSRARVAAALEEWRAFLEEIPIHRSGRLVTGFRLYHESFRQVVHSRTAETEADIEKEFLDRQLDELSRARP